MHSQELEEYILSKKDDPALLRDAEKILSANVPGIGPSLLIEYKDGNVRVIVAEEIKRPTVKVRARDNADRYTRLRVNGDKETVDYERMNILGQELEAIANISRIYDLLDTDTLSRIANVGKESEKNFKTFREKWNGKNVNYRTFFTSAVAEILAREFGQDPIIMEQIARGQTYKDSSTNDYYTQNGEFVQRVFSGI